MPRNIHSSARSQRTVPPSRSWTCTSGDIPVSGPEALWRRGDGCGGAAAILAARWYFHRALVFITPRRTYSRLITCKISIFSCLGVYSAFFRHRISSATQPFQIQIKMYDFEILFWNNSFRSSVSCLEFSGNFLFP